MHPIRAELASDSTWVQCTDLEWSLVVMTLEASESPEVVELGNRITEDVRRQQRLRVQAEVVDAFTDSVNVHPAGWKGRVIR